MCNVVIQQKALVIGQKTPSDFFYFKRKYLYFLEDRSRGSNCWTFTCDIFLSLCCQTHDFNPKSQDWLGWYGCSNLPPSTQTTRGAVKVFRNKLRGLLALVTLSPRNLGLSEKAGLPDWLIQQLYLQGPHGGVTPRVSVPWAAMWWTCNK